MPIDDLIKMIDDIKDKLISIQIKNAEAPNEELGNAIVALKELIDALM